MHDALTYQPPRCINKDQEVKATSKLLNSILYHKFYITIHHEKEVDDV